MGTASTLASATASASQPHLPLKNSSPAAAAAAATGTTVSEPDPSSSAIDDVPLIAWDGGSRAQELLGPTAGRPLVRPIRADPVVESEDNDRDALESKPLLSASLQPAAPAVSGVHASEETDERSTAQVYGAEDSEERQEMEIIQSGKINSAVYLSYAKSAGLLLCAAVITSTAFMQASSSVYVFWLAYWVSHEGKFTSAEFVLISSVIVGFNIACALLRSYLFAKGGLNAAEVFYNRLTKSIFNTKLRFFEITSFGKIINRFGKDTNCIDDQLPFMLNIVLAQVFLMLGSFMVIAISDPLVIVVILLVMIVYYRLQAFYRNSSRMLRRLDSAYRSPVFSLLFDCASNAVCLRALNATPRYDERLERAINASLRASLGVAVASQWLGMRLQLLGALIATSLALSATLTSVYDIFPVSAGILGLSLSYSFSIVSNLNGLVGSLTETEQEMVSVERVQEYVNLESENDLDDSAVLRATAGAAVGAGGADTDDQSCYRQSNEISLLPSSLRRGDTIQYHKVDRDVDEDIESRGECSTALVADKPLCGQIDLINVRMRYSPELPLALRGVSVTIPAGSTVAVVGRTGSGKSSLLRVLLRLNEYEGCIRIGGEDIRTVPVHQLRRKLVVIPQDPVLLSASVRTNLDPTGVTYDDEQLALALQASGFVWTLSSSHWKEIRWQQRHKEQEVLGREQSAGASDTDPSPLPRGVLKKESFGDSEDMQWGHWLQRRQSGELSGAVVSGDDIKSVLNWELANAGDCLSHGQKQLVSLARALLPMRLEASRPSSDAGAGSDARGAAASAQPKQVATIGESTGCIVLIDEATASIDPAAEAALVSVFSRYFSGSACGLGKANNNNCTVLMICHRKDGIRKLSNKELRMADGVVESFTDVE